MDIKKIISEELTGFLDEVTASREPFEFRKRGENSYEIDVVVPEKNINTKYVVNFHPTGNRDEKGYSISFDEKGGSYSDTGMGIPFRIMATVSLVVQDFIREKDVDIFNFSPVRSRGDRKAGRDPNLNRRLNLYKHFVELGAGDEFDGFIIGNNDAMTVERHNLNNYELKNGYQNPETIQDIVKDLSAYRGRYETDLPKNDPDYRMFSIADYGGFFMQDGSGNSKRTISARKFVDWMMSEDGVRYVAGRNEPSQYGAIQQQQQQQQDQPVDAPIQRIGGDNRRQYRNAQLGTFQHFLNSDIYGFDDYQELQPFYDTHKTPEEFDELKTKVERQMWSAEENQRDRLQGIIDAINNLKRAWEQYERAHGTNRTLNEIEENLNELLNN